MNLVVIWVLLVNIYCSSSSKLYVAPDHGNCTVNRTTLRPCCTLQQLIDNDVLAPSIDSGVTFFLLPGTHTIPRNQILRAANFSEVVFQPWSVESEVCQSEASLVFENITN